MTTGEYLVKAVPLVIDFEDKIPYLNPLYRSILRDTLGEPECGWEEMSEALRLVINKYDRVNDYSSEVFKWIKGIIAIQDQQQTEEDNEYLEYLRNKYHKTETNPPQA